MDEPSETKFTDLLMGSFLAAVFVWIWMYASSLVDLHHAPPQIQVTLSIAQYVFFGVGGFIASHIVSKRTRNPRGIGLKIGLGAWIISLTLFMPQSEGVTMATIIMTLVSFITGSQLGQIFQSRKRAAHLKSGS